MSVWLVGVSGFVIMLALTYVVLMVLYFSMGIALELISARHPERRIQHRAASNKQTDIRQSILSLFSISAYVAGGLWLQLSGYTLFNIWELSWWSIIVGLLVSVVIYDAWFYWFHRLMHTKLFYRFHAQHHVSVAPTAWSNNNDNLVGTFFEQSYFLVAPILMPFPPVVFVLHKVWDQVTGMIGHAGHEFFASPSARAPWPGVCTTYHDQHHSYFHFNFANTFTIWDRLCGTLHPRYESRVREFERIADGQPAKNKPS
ncbi:MAG: sterol desaturase family protein [Pseudomonadota bacterium]